MSHDWAKGVMAAATRRPWRSEGYEVYPSEPDAPGPACQDGCDGGCDDDGPIQCERILHAEETIADVYGLREFAEADGRFICLAVNVHDASARLAEVLREYMDKPSPGAFARLRHALADYDRAIADECQRQGGE